MSLQDIWDRFQYVMFWFLLCIVFIWTGIVIFFAAIVVTIKYFKDKVINLFKKRK